MGKYDCTHLHHLVFHARIAVVCFEDDAQIQSIASGHTPKLIEKLIRRRWQRAVYPVIAVIVFFFFSFSLAINVEFPCLMATRMLLVQVVFSYAPERSEIPCRLRER